MTLNSPLRRGKDSDPRTGSIPADGSSTPVLETVDADRRRKIGIILVAAVGLVVVAVVAITIGPYRLSVGEVVRAALSRLGLGAATASVEETIVMDIRFTRIALASVVGAALATSGVTYQGVFRNPLVEPYILGVSSGAAFGAGLSIMFSFPGSIQTMAFVFGLVAVMLTYRLARVRGQLPTITLVLSGVIIGSMFHALFSIFQYIGSNEQLRRLVFWTLGGLYRSTFDEVRLIAPFVLIGVLAIWRLAWRLNVMSLGDDEAAALGVPVERTRLTLVALATAITALVVSLSGIIAWVGLMIPHAARMLVGPDHRYLVPLSALLGAAFLIVCDTIARTLTTGEIPIGIITSIVGAPYLIYLLRTRLDHFAGG